MAQTVTRRFHVYEVSAFTLDLDEGGNPVKVDLFCGDMILTNPNERVLRRAVADALGTNRLPDGTRFEYTDKGEQVYSMTVEDFIEHATIINQ